MTDQTEHTSEAVGLKACPFCGGTEIGHQRKNGGMRQVCIECGACGPDVEGDEEIAATWVALAIAWNQRAPDADLVEALANLLAVKRGHGGTLPDAEGIAERALAKATAK